MTVDEEVRAFNDAYERALAEQHAESLIALYAEDARLMIASWRSSSRSWRHVPSS